MRIGFDISMLVYQGSGVATYTYNLVKNLLQYDKKNEYRLFYSSLRRPKNFYYLDELKKLGAKVYDYPFPPRVLKLWWNKYHLLPAEWFIGKVDIFHSSDFLRPPLFMGTKGITTIHDLTWKIYPEFHTKDVVKAHERKLEKTINYGDTIIVDSYNTKHDLVKFYPNIEKTNKIYVAYPGVDDRFKPIKDKKTIKNVLKKYGLPYPRNYLLYVGAIEPRKNLTTAIKVFHQLISKSTLQSPRLKKYDDLQFLIVGRAGWKNENIFQLVNELRLGKKFRFIGFVEDKDLPYFYNAAKVFIYLSKYEGFGLPPLEAARCSIPSLIYPNSSLKEIFPSNYPFTKKGEEISTLRALLERKIKIDFKYFDKYSWIDFIKTFTHLVNHLP